MRAKVLHGSKLGQKCQIPSGLSRKEPGENRQTQCGLPGKTPGETCQIPSGLLRREQGEHCQTQSGLPRKELGENRQTQSGLSPSAPSQKGKATAERTRSRLNLRQTGLALPPGCIVTTRLRRRKGVEHHHTRAAKRPAPLGNGPVRNRLCYAPTAATGIGRTLAAASAGRTLNQRSASAGFTSPR